MRPWSRNVVICGVMVLAVAGSAIAGNGAGPATQPAPETRRPFSLDDLEKMRGVGDPRISPDGEWVAYSVRRVDVARDKTTADLYMTSWDGSRTVQLTHTEDSESTPRWSPDGRYLAFLSARDNEKETTQVWLLDRQGGEAARLTDFPGDVEDYAWSPDGKRLAIIASDPDPEAEAKAAAKDGDEARTPKPIVITRYQFKEDYTGYMLDLHQHLYLFDLTTRKARILTPGTYDEYLPSWSPDGTKIAFVTKRGDDPDRHENFDIYVIDARAGATARQITTDPGKDCDPAEHDDAPAWSPDGRFLACTLIGPPELYWYTTYHLAITPVEGGPTRLLTKEIDRNVSQARFSADGQTLTFLLEDDRSVQLARIPVAGGKEERLTPRGRTVDAYDVGPGGRIALLSATLQAPDEVQVLETGGGLRPLSRQNDSLLAQLRLPEIEEISVRSKDGTTVNGFLVKPVDYRPGTKYPTVLDIHGGPTSQRQHEFMDRWQQLASHGYAVVSLNPRGSTGRGEAFCKAIFADWYRKPIDDVLAGVDWAVAKGIADPQRLAIGGWSYGSMLTNAVIAADKRFKAAVSGAGASNVLAEYGTDQYIVEYDVEFGPPWKNLEIYLRHSDPFLHADRIVTPTLFMGVLDDYNMPALNSEQMYQALRSLGRDTQLVLYPSGNHDMTVPSYDRDHLERWVAWYDKHLKAGTPGAIDPDPKAPPTDRPTRAGE